MHDASADVPDDARPRSRRRADPRDALHARVDADSDISAGDAEEVAVGPHAHAVDTHAASRPATEARHSALPSIDIELRPGDVLLSRGASQLSQWMAWNAAGPYSHASLLLTPRLAIDARMPRVAVRTLDSLMGEQARVDVYRPRNRDGTPLDEGQRASAIRHALRLRGTPFALGSMPGLALRTWIRRRSSHAAQRHARAAAVRPGDTALSCTELVYLVLHEACRLRVGGHALCAQPRPRLAPLRLWREFRQARAERRTDASPRIASRPRPLPPLPAHLIPTQLATSPDLAPVARLK